MDFNELLQVLWRRKLIVAGLTAIVIALAFVALRLVTPIYESSSTLTLGPKKLDNNTYFYFATMDTIVPIYADAATSRSTKDAASASIGHSLSGVTVETFKGTPILKIKSRSTDRALARDTAQAVSDELIRRSSDGEVGLPSLNLTQLDRAVMPSTPVFPNKRLTYIVAALLGLALGVGAALLRENLGTKVETADELARVAGAPAFAEIPNENALRKVRSPEEFVAENRLSIVAEALRDLRTNLLFSESDLRSLIVTSPDGSHGKTTISFGLAVTLARAGTRTILIDGDLRRGRLAELLRVERSPGLMEVLRGETAVEDAIRSTALESLDIVTGGRRAGDPGELLTVEFASILGRLEEQYEAVVIDGTPVVPVNDARIISRYVDATILVASAGAATRRQVRAAVDRLSLIGVRPAAVVLNNSRERGDSSYYYVTEPPEPTLRAGKTKARGAVR